MPRWYVPAAAACICRQRNVCVSSTKDKRKNIGTAWKPSPLYEVIDALLQASICNNTHDNDSVLEMSLPVMVYGDQAGVVDAFMRLARIGLPVHVMEGSSASDLSQNLAFLQKCIFLYLFKSE